MNPVDDLRYCAHVLARTSEPRCARVAERLQRLLEEDVSPEEALGLATEPGQRSWRTKARIDRRNALIREWRKRFHAGASVSAAAAAIVTAARRYQASAWIRDRRLIDPPPHYAGTERELLFYALKACDRFPAGVRHVIEILRQTDFCSELHDFTASDRCHVEPATNRETMK